MVYVKSLLTKLGVQVPHVMVNTAYTNSKANIFLDKNEINRKCVPTGVKNAHPVVMQYVIGANDEPNGHGTVYVNWPELNELLKDKMDHYDCKKLIAFLRLTNLYVGDAICNLLMIEAVLMDLGYSMAQFDRLYVENPSRMWKIKVPDRSIFKTVWDETRLVDPLWLQEFIDKVNASVPEGHSFVRPSGTEDVLRLYTEAKIEKDVDRIANMIIVEIDDKFRIFTE